MTLRPKNLSSDDLDFVLEHTRDLWEELRGENIFVTGGTGFFGCWLLETFAWANEKLGLKSNAVILTRNPASFSEKCPHLAAKPYLTFVTGDIRTFAFPEGHFPIVIHAATDATTALDECNPLAMFDTIVGGTRRALDFAVHCRAKKFLLASSGAVYGRQPAEMTNVPEDFAGAPNPLDPRSTYGEGKRLSELLCATYAKHYQIETKVARCFAFVGPHLPLDTHFAIGNFIRDAMEGTPIFINGDGTPERSYLYAADLAVWLWTILFRGDSCRAYNVGSSQNISIKGLAECVKKVSGNKVEVRIAEAPVAGAQPIRYVPCNKRAETELGLTQRVSLDEGIRRTIAWHTPTA